ncbi:hypothetical protein F8568_020480 [Actinomadura sp. LD22]|uniref:DUF1273 domain-containing protein n=1 Tax=Actinomadura physcomitrii TaxID=2650748 RepID=A0A6I4MJA0_9ACTN|nr:hypothetical protein [Actinomadura physcomitrii]MWA02709.1 hypothetical protein [Actinomadura physcomitrii]
MRIAISGHRSLPPATETLVAEALDEALSPITGGITGLTCLADGADTLFSRAVLAHGSQIEVIVPAEHYLAGLPEEHHAEYRKLLTQAAQVHRMPFIESTSEAHMAASQHMLTLADELWAVWDGQPARGYGGTADVVQAARDLNKPVRIIWPDGATRD